MMTRSSCNGFLAIHWILSVCLPAVVLGLQQVSGASVTSVFDLVVRILVLHLSIWDAWKISFCVMDGRDQCHLSSSLDTFCNQGLCFSSITRFGQLWLVVFRSNCRCHESNRETIATSTAFHFLFDDRLCTPRWLPRVRWLVQPHVLDRWCVGLVICILRLLCWGCCATWSKLVAMSKGVWEKQTCPSHRIRFQKFPNPLCSALTSCPRFVKCLVLMALLHSGEAHNPGPMKQLSDPKIRSWSLGTFNPSGLGGKHQVISSYLHDCDIWAVSETHLTSRAMQSFRKTLRSSKSDFQFCVGGTPVPLRPHSDQTGEWSGVAMMAKHPTRQLPVQLPKQTADTSRVLITSTLCSDIWITGAVLYGEPPGVSHPDAQSNTDILAHDLFQVLHPIGGLRFFAGDFNFEKGGLEIFQTLEAAGYRDLQDIAYDRWGIIPQKTCKQSTRKDFCFISPELQVYLVDVKVDHTFWADHAIVQGFFSGESTAFVRHHWRVPAQVEWPESFSCEFPQEWYQIPNPEDQYSQMWNQVEQSASVTKVAQGQLPFPQKCRGRGQTLEVQLKKGHFQAAPTKQGRKGDVRPTFVGTSYKHAHWFRQLRRLQSYCRFRKVNIHDTTTAHGAALWRSILAAKGFQEGFQTWWSVEGSKIHGAPNTLPLVPPSETIARTIYESFLLDVRCLEKILHSQQKKFAKDRRQELAHLIFSDLKRTSPERVDVLLKVNSGLVSNVDSDNAFLQVETSHSLVDDQPIFIDGIKQEVIYIHENEIWLPSVEGIQVGSEVRQSSFCGAAQDMFQAFEKEWKVRWDRHKDVPHSQWSQICAFARAHIQTAPCTTPPMTVQAIRAEISRKKSRSATGLDGVSLTDLKSMPDTVISAYSHLFELAEQNGQWPSQLVTGKVASLAKVPCPETVQAYRPITVLSHGYRLWSGLRAKFLLAHLHPHCPSFLFGNRPHCQASQVWTYLAWTIEASHASNEPIGGIIADVEKAFNHLPREVVFQTALALGLPQSLLVAWSGALGKLTRRFQIRDHLGPPILSSTGYPEGCALSCVAMMLMDFIFHRWFESSFPRCQPVSYVDDLQIITKCPEQIPEMFEHLLDFVHKVDLTIDKKKTFVWSNSAYFRSDFRSKALRLKSHSRGLGAQLHFTRKHSTQVLQARLRDLDQIWPKLRCSQSPYKVKVHAVKQAAWTRGLHGVAASSVSRATYTKLRTNVMRGLAAEGAGCNPIVHLGMIEQPALDPQCWSIIETLRTVREAASHDQLGPLLQDALDPDSNLPNFSLTALLINRLHVLGWSFSREVQVCDSLSTFSLLDISFPELVLRVGWAWANFVASEVEHRSTFQGLRSCDPAATRRYLSSLDVCDQGLFRKALNGAHFTQDYICHYSDNGATVCEFCGAQDSRHHRFWECPVFNSERQHCSPAFWSLLPELPPSLTLHGWALRSSTWLTWNQTLLQISLPQVHFTPAPFSASDEWLDIFSDGSCLWPQTPDLRLAAWAIVQAHPSGEVAHSQVLMAGPVPGLLQSAFRAELMAVQQALLYAKHWGRKLRIWSDCQSVVSRLVTMLTTKAPPAINGSHADLWRDIHETLESLNFQSRVQITKVAAHQDVSQTLVAAEFWAFTHNAAADRAARLANLQRTESFWTLHKAHSAAVDFAEHVTKEVQQTILNISRKVVMREVLSKDDAIEQAAPTHVQPLMSEPAPEWQGFTPKVPLPLSCTAKFNHRYVASVTAWFQKGLEEADGIPAQWISIHQLFLDYQFQTGELGPIWSKQWVDTADQTRYRLRPHPFKRRSSWFGRSLRGILREHGCIPPNMVTRAASSMLALHLFSLAIPWPQWRLQIIDDWLSQHLPHHMAATRNGVQLIHLPPAKRDDRWPKLCLVPSPLEP